MPSSRSHGQPGPLTNTPFGRKLGYYLLGIAIGLMIVGMIVSTRQQFLAPGQSQPGGSNLQPGPAPGAGGAPAGTTPPR